MAPIGFRILPFAPQPSPGIIAALRKTATAHLSDNMHCLHAIGPDLWPCHRGGKLVGTALTVKVGPGNNLMVLPQALPAATITLALDQAKKEAALLKTIHSKGKVDRRWVDETLRAKGCAIPARMRSR